MDRIMIDYLRNKGMEGMYEHDFKHKFNDFMTRYKRNSMGRGSRGYSRDSMREDYFPMERMDSFYRHGKPDDYMETDEEDMYNMMRYMRHSMNEEDHLSESEAKYIVSDMYHTEKGRKHTGEKYDMHKAKEVCERYKGILPHHITPIDVYVALNSQYHDYAELFKNWFGDNIDQKIIESAIVFWFKDVDCKAENKVLEYFKEY
jgi:hypothetical protein